MRRPRINTGYLSAEIALQYGMPELTRRHSERPDCWHIYYGDVYAGTIARRVGNPFGTDPWEWNCGFYPGSHPGEHRSATAATFEQARADFETAWALFLSKRAEADFQAWRDATLDPGSGGCPTSGRASCGLRSATRPHTDTIAYPTGDILDDDRVLVQRAVLQSRHPAP